ncbi:MAG: glycerol kinase GlpK [Treponema sp.]|nr:glycerol kinase GlpK [Treponema sp.]
MSQEKENPKYIIALDQGTTSSRAVIYNNQAKMLFSKNIEFPQIYPQPGWVEHDPMEIFETQIAALKYVIKQAKAKPTEIAAIGITNQRETVILWDKNTGKPVYNAIVWQCRRTAKLCELLIKKGKSQIIQEKTGLIVDAYFSGTKLKWILDSDPKIKKQAKNGNLLAGTVDTWLIWKLSGGKVHITDKTNASRTMLYNIHTLNWDEDLLKLLDIPRCILPEVKNSSEIYGMTDASICGFSVPIASSIGDQQAALFGQGCFSKGQAKNTYGTGCFLLLNTGEKPVKSKNKLITTIALSLNDKVTYALEGSVFMGGATIQWLRDELEIISCAPEIDKLAESVPNSNGAVLVPAFTGLGAPHWDMYARGTFLGLTRGVKKAHICRATLEAIALQVKDVIDAMTEDANIKLKNLKVDGGASVSDVMLQFQSDILKTQVIRPKNVETTSLGAAFLAGLAVGFWKNTDELLQCWQVDKVFNPQMDKKTCTTIEKNWKKAIQKAKNWAES